MKALKHPWINPFLSGVLLSGIVLGGTMMIAQRSEREEIREEFLARTTVQSAECLLQVARALRAPQTSQEFLLKETEQKGLRSLLVLLLSMRGKSDAAGEMAFGVYKHLTNNGVSIEWKEIAEADRVWLEGLQRK